MTSIVIIGAGQAGLTAAVALRERGHESAIHLVGEEVAAPYSRPPLSKGYLAGAEARSDLLLHSIEGLQRAKITMHLGNAAIRVNRALRAVELVDGTVLTYETLIFATGSAARDLAIRGYELPGVHTLRTIGDADALREDLSTGGSTVFIGGGFLGLEVASQAVKNSSVIILEQAPQLLGRVLSLDTAEALTRSLLERGAKVRCGVAVEGIEGESGRVAAVVLESGERIPADRVVVSVGAVARDELARQSGLETDNAILVNSSLQTSDENVYAIGDCAKFPSIYAETEMRVESVQNATDQARYVADRLSGREVSDYRAVPWFWSQQGDQKLQIAGIAMPSDGARLIESQGGKLVVERIRDKRVVAVETINSAAAHIKARRELQKTFRFTEV